MNVKLTFMVRSIAGAGSGNHDNNGNHGRGLRIALAAIGLVAMLVASCGRGDLPTFESGSILRTSATELATSLPAAPDAVIALAVPDTLSGAPSIDDAVDQWEADPLTTINHIGPCEFTTPTIGDPSDSATAELCSTAGPQPNTIYLGPESGTVWHVLVIEETNDGFRVADAAVAGR